MVEQGSSPAIVLSCADRWGRAITLSGANWIYHILVRHPELAPLLATLEATLTNPERVMHDAGKANRENFYSSGLLPPPFDHLLLKVCVEYRELGDANRITGQVVTAFPIPDVSSKEVQKWP